MCRILYSCLLVGILHWTSSSVRVLSCLLNSNREETPRQGFYTLNKIVKWSFATTLPQCTHCVLLLSCETMHKVALGEATSLRKAISMGVLFVVWFSLPASCLVGQAMTVWDGCDWGEAPVKRGAEKGLWGRVEGFSSVRVTWVSLCGFWYWTVGRDDDADREEK